MAQPSRQHVVAGVASMVGTTIEWYDFFLYGTAAALIFNKLFFPAFDPLTGTLAAFGWSVAVTVAPGWFVAHGVAPDVYFEAVVLIIAFVLLAVAAKTVWNLL